MWKAVEPDGTLNGAMRSATPQYAQLWAGFSVDVALRPLRLQSHDVTWLPLLLPSFYLPGSTNQLRAMEVRTFIFGIL